MLPAVRGGALTSLRLRALDLGDRVRGRADRPAPLGRLRRLRGRQRLPGHRRRVARPCAVPRRAARRPPRPRCRLRHRRRLARTLTDALDPAAARRLRRLRSRRARRRLMRGALSGALPLRARRPAQRPRQPRRCCWGRPGYRFPADDGWATLVVATSVFTHLDRPEVADLATWLETRRAMAPGVGGWRTFFLLDDLTARRARRRGAHASRSPSLPG